MSAPRKYPDYLVARVKALCIAGFGHKRIANLTDLPVGSIRHISERPKPEPDMTFLERLKAFCKGET